MAGLIKRLLGLETPVESFERKAANAKRMLDAAGIPVTNTIDELKKIGAVTQAFGVLNLPRDPELQKIDPAISQPAFSAVIAYRNSMQAALASVPNDKVAAAARDTQIFGARRTFLASVPVTVTASMVTEIDQHLGLPPIDPALGLTAAI